MELSEDRALSFVSLSDGDIRPPGAHSENGLKGIEDVAMSRSPLIDYLVVLGCSNVLANIGSCATYA
jgi:hypothetical protein